MPVSVARIKAAKLHLVSIGSRDDMAALRSPAGRISGVSWSSSDLPEEAGPVKAPMMRLVRVRGGLLLLFPAGGDMASSGYRWRWGTPNHPGPAGSRGRAGYGYGPANPPGRLAQLVRGQPSHGWGRGFESRSAHQISPVHDLASRRQLLRCRPARAACVREG